jgi:hypothetical protein
LAGYFPFLVPYNRRSLKHCAEHIDLQQIRGFSDEVIFLISIALRNQISLK